MLKDPESKGYLISEVSININSKVDPFFVVDSRYILYVRALRGLDRYFICRRPLGRSNLKKYYLTIEHLSSISRRRLGYF